MCMSACDLWLFFHSENEVVFRGASVYDNVAALWERMWKNLSSRHENKKQSKNCYSRFLKLLTSSEVCRVCQRATGLQWYAGSCLHKVKGWRAIVICQFRNQRDTLPRDPPYLVVDGECLIKGAFTLCRMPHDGHLF